MFRKFWASENVSNVSSQWTKCFKDSEPVQLPPEGMPVWVQPYFLENKVDDDDGGGGDSDDSDGD